MASVIQPIPVGEEDVAVESGNTDNEGNTYVLFFDAQACTTYILVSQGIENSVITPAVHTAINA